jgi:acyl-CoA synthetase (AMP-forming)/AMP-acid ligase II
MQNNNVWQQLLPVATRQEAHYGDRITTCFPDRPRNLDDMFRQTVARFPDQEALVFGKQRLTYKELDKRVDAVAVNLHSLDLESGERVAVYMANSIELIVAYFGILRAGLAVVPIGILQQKPELEYAINNCTASVLLFDAESAARVPDRAQTPSVLHYYAVGAALDGTQSFSDLEVANTTAPLLDIDEEAVSFIMHTSGTTGKPKGAELTHLSLWHAVKHHELTIGVDHTSRTILVIPGTHVSGVAAIIVSTIQVGACLVIVRGFNTRELLALLRDEKITDAMFVPTILTRLLLEPDFDDFKLADHWRSALYGGAPMPESSIERLHKHLPNLRLHQGYGATESSAVTVIIPADQTALRPLSVGAATHCYDIRIMDDDGREIGADEVGEIWIGGPGVVKGYWNNPAESARNFIGGYWRSGDVGTLDSEGYLRILDRRKDVIIRGGFKVFSVEVENVLSFIEGVVEAAVVPSPCPVLGERVHVFIYANIELTEESVREYCKTQVADYKVPDFITLSKEPLPRNLNGKLVKAPLRELALQMAQQRLAAGGKN